MTYDAGSVQPYLVGAEVHVFLHQQPKIKKAFQKCILLLARSKKETNHMYVYLEPPFFYFMQVTKNG